MKKLLLIIFALALTSKIYTTDYRCICDGGRTATIQDTEKVARQVCSSICAGGQGGY